MLISLLHPSRSRCTKSLQTTKLWKQKAGSVNYELIVSLDSDDPQLQCYLTYYPNALVGDNGSAVNAINAAARIARGDVLVVLSDDTECPDQWSEKIAHAVAGEKDCVIKVWDGVQPWIVTMPVLTRDYFMSQACGNGQYIYYPDYKHMFCLHPDSQVFMGDYSFKRIGDIGVGDSVIGTERRKGRAAKVQTRDFLCRSKVTAVHKRISQIYELTLESGKKLRSTIDHKWGYYNGSREVCYGIPKLGRRLKKIIDVPGTPPEGMDWDRGWLAGMWDGEGSFDVITQSVNHNPAVCKRIEETLKKIGLQFSITHYKNKVWKNSIQRVFTINGGRNEYIKLLNWLNPVKRVTKRADKRMLSARYGSPDPIVDIKYIGDGEVVCITTETGNFIADGYLSHNCDTEFTHIADSSGKIIQRHDLAFLHKHYSVLRQQPDEINRRNDRTWNQGKEIYLRRFRESFGIVGLDPWRLSDEQHKEWLKINNV